MSWGTRVGEVGWVCGERLGCREGLRWEKWGGSVETRMSWGTQVGEVGWVCDERLWCHQGLGREKWGGSVERLGCREGLGWNKWGGSVVSDCCTFCRLRVRSGSGAASLSHSCSCCPLTRRDATSTRVTCHTFSCPAPPSNRLPVAPPTHLAVSANAVTCDDRFHWLHYKLPFFYLQTCI